MAYVIQPEGGIQIVLARPTQVELSPQHAEDIQVLVGIERGVPGSDDPPYPTTGTYIPAFRLYREALTETDFGREDSLVGTTVPLIWVELALADGTYVYAKVDLPDPASYYGGWKEGRLLAIGAVKRALSDRLGNYEAAQFSFALTDTDRFIRGKLGGAATKWFMNRFVTMRMISDVGRRALLVPRVIAIGYLRDYAPISPLQFQITCEDYLALFVGLGDNERQIPKRTINRIDFTDAPLDQVGKPVPIVYGVVSDETSTTGQPTITGTPALGYYVQDGVPIAGFGATGVLAAPTGVGIAQNGPGTGTVSTDVPNGEWGVIVTAVDGSGQESDPSSYFWNSENGGRGSWNGLVPTVTPSDATRSLTVSWSAVASAVKYRVYLGWYYYGGRFQQMIEVTAPTVSATFDKGAAWSQEANTSNIATGAQLITFGERHQYRVSAVMADGETGLSQFVTAYANPYRRPIRVEWNAVAGAIEYRVYRFDQFGNFEGRRWTTSAATTYFDDDLLDTNVELLSAIPAATGAVPLIPVGTEVDAGGARWYRFLVAGHAVKAIDSVFLDGVKVDSGNFGVTWAVPGKTGYSTYFPNTGSPQFRDLNGRRYTCVYVRGPDGDAAGSGSKKITANIQGVEDAGDGGGTLIQDGFDQYLHAMRNWILGDYQSGAWPSTGPAWPSSFGAAAVEVLDDASFLAAKAIAESRIAGGYQGNFILGANGELQTTRTWIQRFNVSLDCYCGFSRKSQFFVRMLDPDLAILAAARKYTQVLDIHQGSFRVVDQVANLENVIVYSYWRNYATNAWLKDTLEGPDTDSITNSQQTKRSQTLELWLHRSQTSADDVVNRRLLRTKEPPRLVTFRTGLQALNTELGDVIKVTHIEGVGTGGWVDRAVFIVRHELDPDGLTITMEGYDVDRLFQGAFILGDETSLAATWTTADATDQSYGYLGDEVTGEFSNGDPIKRLR